MRQKKIEALQKLMEVASTIRNSYLDKAQAQGKKIVGVIYHELPVEVFTAAGCVPVALRGTGSDGMEYAESYFRQLTCNYIRYTFNQICDGAWDFLDGAVIYNHCDHARRIFDNWKLLPEGHKCYHFFYAPKKSSPLSKEFYTEQVKKLIKATEEFFGVTITPEKLSAAIALHNEMRRLQQQVYAMQAGEDVYLTGTELLMVMLAGMSMPVEDYIELLKQLIAELKAAGETMRPSVRLLYMGGNADNIKFFETVEDQGAQIVMDITGYGYAAAAGQICQKCDPLAAICDYYFDVKPNAPRRHGTSKVRKALLSKLIADYKIDGIVSSRIIMCDLWAYEQFILRDYLNNTSQTPFLELEIDYIPDSLGQIATRVQAFVESICAKKSN